VDGLLDWYLLGVVAGLGVSDGVIGTAARRPLLGLVFVLLGTIAVVVAVVALPLWAIAVFAAVTLASWFLLRRLSPDARLLAALGAAALAAVPALGYALVALAPVAGARLRGRAASRYAGLRVLAKD
jgi:hypothetical protein